MRGPGPQTPHNKAGGNYLAPVGGDSPLPAHCCSAPRPGLRARQVGCGEGKGPLSPAPEPGPRGTPAGYPQRGVVRVRVREGRADGGVQPTWSLPPGLGRHPWASRGTAFRARGRASLARTQGALWVLGQSVANMLTASPRPRLQLWPHYWQPRGSEAGGGTTEEGTEAREIPKHKAWARQPRN